VSELSAHEWTHLKDLLAEYLRTPEREQATFAARRCGTDTALGARLTRLIQASEQAGSLLDRPIDDVVRAWFDEPAPEQTEDCLDPGSRVGPFRVLRVLGQGGMGVAYLAERADGQFERQVALKLLRRRAERPSVREAFLRERQILARLQHPNIAALYDGGLTDDNRLWFAMEYIEGVPITRYCTEHTLSIESRLRLFGAAARAVRHAHEHLVVHRDLKPSNILVDHEGQVKLLDFGNAKTLGAVGAQEHARWGQLHALTPEYAAPEQFGQGPITTAVDVFALGVVLRELLSTHGATGPDLAAVVSRATAQAPEDRYSSVQSLVDDLERYRRGFPVLARRPSPVRRLALFARRNRGAVGAAAAVVSLLMAGLAATAWQARKAERAAVRADRVADLLVSVFEVSDPDQSQGNEISARQLLDRGSERMGRELADQPELRSDMRMVLANVYGKLGLRDQALQLIEQALATREALFGRRDARVAEALNTSAQVLMEQGEYDAAAARFDEALELRRGLLGERHPDVATTLDNRAELHRRSGDLLLADSLARDALDLRRALLGPEHRDIAWSLNNLGVIVREQGDYVEAGELFRTSLGMKRRLFAEEHSEVLLGLVNLANLLRLQREFEEAERLQREVLERHLELFGEDHPTTIGSLNNLASILYQSGSLEEAEARFRRITQLYEHRGESAHPNAVASLNNLAVVLRDQGALDESVAVSRQATEGWKQALGANHPNVGISLNNLALVLMAAGDAAEAETVLLEAREITHELPHTHVYRISVITSLGTLWQTTGRCSLAEPALLELLETWQDDAGPRPAEALVALGRCRAAANRWAEAEALLSEGLEGLASQPSKRAAYAAVRAELAAAYDSLGRSQQAAELRAETS